MFGLMIGGRSVAIFRNSNCGKNVWTTESANNNGKDLNWHHHSWLIFAIMHLMLFLVSGKRISQ